MIRAYRPHDGGLTAVTLTPQDPASDLSGVVWVDVFDPDPDDFAFLEEHVGVVPPSRADMDEIEASSRIYTQGGTTFMTAVLPAGGDTDRPEMSPVTFALDDERLLTLRYHDPRSFRAFAGHAGKGPGGCASGQAVLLGLLEEIVDRLADILERAGMEIEAISRQVFRRPDPATRSKPDFRVVLDHVGAKGDLLSNLRYSLLSIDRLIGYLGQLPLQARGEKAARGQIKTLTRDTRSLIDHADYLSQKVTFLLDATLGMIGIEQNAIIKIFSVAAVAFLPPTLIASIYGMNFAHMPELDWPFGYPMALGLMAVSAALPLWYFRRRGWL